MKITFVNGPREGETLTLQPPGVCIGRETDNDIQLLVAGISRYHAKISFDGLKWSIQDLGSTNGTKINKKLITELTVLLPGDEITLGDQTLLFGDSFIDPHKQETVKNMGPLTAPPPVRVPLTQTPIPPAKPQPAPEKTATIPEKASSPIPVPIPVPAPASQSNPTTDKKDDSKIFSVPKVNIFAKKEASEPESKNAETKRPDGKHINMKRIFPVLVVVVAFIIVAAFIKMNFMTPPEKTEENKEKAPPEFLVHYERTKIDKDNVFRFELILENDTATFVLDDLKYGREFKKTFEKVNSIYLKNLEESVRGTEFMKLKQEVSPKTISGGSDEKRLLTIAIDHKINTVEVHNSYAQSSFENIERAIERFAADNGISTVSMNVAEMRKYAFDTFRTAENLFANYQAKSENLREAIKRYKLAMGYLDQFVPKPEEWDRARKRLIEAEEIYRKIMKDFEYNIFQYRELKQYDKASAECQKAMDTVEPGSELYNKLKRYKLAFDKQRRK